MAQTQTQTYLKAGNASFKSGKASLRAGAYNKAAQNFEHAVRMYQHHEWTIARSLKSPAINIAQRFLCTAIQRRDGVAA